MADTAIQWTDVVWNPTTGCDRVSAGCDHCYALTLAKRLKAMGSAKYQTDGGPRTSGPGFGIAVHPDALDIPLHWKKPRRIFVNSMSDLFHARVPRAFVAEVFAVMARTPQHTYQVLTKRPQRARRLLTEDLYDLMAARLPDPEPRGVPWPLPNLWLGTSVEDQQRADERVPALLGTPAAVRWISAEPLLGPVDLSRWLRPWPGYCQTCGAALNPPNAESCAACGLSDYDDGTAAARRFARPGWVVIGGESGPGARPMDLDWARSLVSQCQAAGAAAFVKQLGERWARDAGCCAHDRHGGDPDGWPADLRIREYPEAVRHG